MNKRDLTFLITHIDTMRDTIDRRFDAIDRRFDSIEGRLDRIEGRLDTVIDTLAAHIADTHGQE